MAGVGLGAVDFALGSIFMSYNAEGEKVKVKSGPLLEEVTKSHNFKEVVCDTRGGEFSTGLR